MRGMVGLALAVDLSQRPTLALAAAVTLWCYGTAFVTSRWAIEAISFASARNGRLVWSARADQAREHLWRSCGGYHPQSRSRTKTFAAGFRCSNIPR